MKIIIIDDDVLVTTSLKIILESKEDIHIMAVGHDGKEALKLYKEHEPDLVLMDIRMKEMSGLQASEEIMKYDENAKILLLTTFNDDEYIINAINLGVKGYLLKQDYDDLLPAIEAASKGQLVLGKEINCKLTSFMNNKENTKESIKWTELGITEKELKIIACISEGYNNKEISDQLFLSEGTIRNYLSIILEKLNLRDRTQLAIFYLKNK